MEDFYKIEIENSTILWTNKLEEKEFKRFFPLKRVIFPKQNHSSLILWEEGKKILICDGVFTKEKNIFVGVKTADCVPLIISNEKFVGAVHCGWRGLSKGILENLKNLILKENILIEECKFFLGPSICKNCYEVKEDVGNLFPSHFKKGKLDLKGFIFDFLIKNGAFEKNILIDKNCTYCNKFLPSYRRDKTKGRILTGVFKKY
jgi:YfiH family protein